MVVTNDPDLYERLMIMRAHGSKPKYYHKFIGGNFRLDPLQAAILLVKLPYLGTWSEARRRHAAFYNQAFAGSCVQSPWIHPDCISIYNQYVIRVHDRDALLQSLKQETIGTEVYYPVSMHQQECFAGKCRVSGLLDESEMASRNVLALPIYPELTPEQLDYVAGTVLRFAQPIECTALSEAVQ
jgi:dTDP-4-amino-4,6-dideoxygalactose transaminase